MALFVSILEYSIAVIGGIVGFLSLAILFETRNEKQVYLFDVDPEATISDIHLLLAGEVLLLFGLYARYLGGAYGLRIGSATELLAVMAFSLIATTVLYRWWGRFH